LELGLQEVFSDTELLWYAESDEKPSLVLAERYPGIPNLGDITKIDFAGLPIVDVLCAGYPCQPFSEAGQRKGFDDPRNVWPNILEAIRNLRPRLVFMENVRGHLNRGFPEVTASLAAIGYVGRWECVRASDVGAPHRRERLYFAAWPQGTEPPRPDRPGAGSATGDVDEGVLLPSPRAGDGVRGAENRSARTGTGGTLPDAVALLPTPRASDGDKGSRNQHGSRGDLTLPSAAMRLLPTPLARDHKGSAPGSYSGTGRPLSEEVMRLLPTPTASRAGNNRGGALGREGQPVRPSLDSIEKLLPTEESIWGEYAPAISRWETATSREAPLPTMIGQRGKPVLSPRFVEWMMGLPEGWVTDIIANRPAALKILGNGVVRQAAGLALRKLLGD
jgi:DNA (cytosine-5)-methyltransferase 1